MRCRMFGDTDMKVSVICFGGGALADWPQYGLTRDDGLRAMGCALEVRAVQDVDFGELYVNKSGRAVTHPRAV